MTDATLGETAAIARLRSVSPSRYVALQKCPLQEVWASNHAPRLLPTSPWAEVGRVAHRLIQESAEGAIDSVSPHALEHRWDELVDEAEETMLASWLDRFLVPLSHSVADYAVRRAQAISRAAALAGAPHRRGVRLDDRDRMYGFELPVSTRDGIIRGRIDRAVRTPSGPVLQDFKTGRIFDSEGRTSSGVVEEYRVQLQMYAALYFATHDIWPIALEIVPVQGEPVAVPYRSTDSLSLVQSGRDLLASINKLVDDVLEGHSAIDALARPSATVCSFCRYRPQCKAYLRINSHADTNSDVTPTDQWPDDVQGTVQEVTRLQNGKLLATIATLSGMTRVRAITYATERHPAICNLVAGRKIAFFNLRRPAGGGTLMEGAFTVLYDLGA